MSIRKNKPESDFTQLPNLLILDTTISAKAFKILVYLWSLPDNWAVNNTDVAKKLKISKEMLAKYWKELIKTGWITRYNRTRVNGKLGTYDYHLNEVPALSPTGDLQAGENTSQVKNNDGGDSVLTNTHSSYTNTVLTNKRETNNKQKKRKEEVQQVIEYFNHTCKRNVIVGKILLCNINILLDQYTLEEIILVIDYVRTSPWHIEHGQVKLYAITNPSKFQHKLDSARYPY